MTIKQIGFVQPQISFGDWQTNLVESCRLLLVDTLGLSPSLALERAKEEIDGSSAIKCCNSLESHGMAFSGAEVLDIGCGPGTMAIEIGRRGGRVIGIEPFTAWRQIAQQRTEGLPFRNRVTIMNGDAEELPFKNGSFDYILSLQVLEHVRKVPLAIREMARVLKPGGIAYVSCENYLAFREQHYRVAWVPLLPKSLAAIYLRSLGRETEFLQHHITYTTYPLLIWQFLDAGMWSIFWPENYRRHRPLIRFIRLLILHRRNIFGIGFNHILQRQ